MPTKKKSFRKTGLPALEYASDSDTESSGLHADADPDGDSPLACSSSCSCPYHPVTDGYRKSLVQRCRSGDTVSVVKRPDIVERFWHFVCQNFFMFRAQLWCSLCVVRMRRHYGMFL